MNQGWVRKLADLTEYDRGDALVKELINNERMVAGLTSLKVGASHTTKVHDHEDEIYWVLSGEGEVTLDSDRHKVTTDSIVFIPHGVAHSMKNYGNEPLVYLYFGSLFTTQR